MPASRIGPIKHLWLKWKALRLPWRKRFFIGFDLNGNTYWEFRLTSNETRWRRIVQYPRSTPYSQVVVTPHWHQWLRHMRDHPPSLEEQRGDLVRQERMKILARKADERWESKPKVMEDGREPRPALEKPTTTTSTTTTATTSTTSSTSSTTKHDPWAAAQRPREKWQPAAWDPAPAKKQ